MTSDGAPPQREDEPSSDRSRSPTRLIEIVARAGAAAAAELDLMRLCDVIVEQTRLLEADVAVLFLAEAELGELRLASHRGLPRAIAQRVQRLPFEAPALSGRAARTRKVQVVHRVEELEPAQVLARDLFRSAGLSSGVAAPLVWAGRLVGVLFVANAQPRHFTEADVAAIRAVADVDAASLEAARAVQVERARFESLRVAALAVATPAELGSVLHNVVEHARTLAGAGYAALGIVDATHPDRPFERWVFSGLSELEASRIGRSPRPVGLLGAVADGGKTIRLSDLTGDDRFLGFPADHPPMASFLGVPLRFLDRTVGSLYLANGEGAAEFSQVEQDLAEMLAQHAGAAVDHAQEHDRLLREVAERERDEELLRQREQRFRCIADNAPDVIARCRLRPSFALEYLSPVVHEVLGHTPEDYYREPGLLRRQVHPSDRWLLDLALHAPERIEGPLTLRCIRPCGAIVWIESRLVPIRDGAGELLASEIIARDVTDRKRAEAEIERLLDRLQVDRAWLEIVFQHSPVGIILVEDRLGKRIRANPAVEEIFGRALRPERGVDQLLEHLRDAHGGAVRHDALLVVRALEGESVTGEQLCVRPDGREVPVLVGAAPVRRDTRSGVAGAVAIYKDVSALKDLERLREEWTSIIAHDLRQPVTVLAMGASALAKELAGSPASAKTIARMRAAVAALTRMVDDLLDFSRLEARRLPLCREAVDVPTLAREVVDRMQETLAGRAVSVDPRGEIPPLEADSLRVGQVLGNLLSNAAKYGAPGTPIEVTVEPIAGEVVVSVTNRGEAIPDEQLPTLFDRFRRAERAARAGSRGAGLGLYIAKGLIEAHGGRIWAESAPGVGTTFRFSLPGGGVARGRAA